MVALPAAQASAPAVTLGAVARGLLEQVKRAWPRELPALGARLYRLQHSGEAQALSAAEWGRVWAAYHARRASRAA